MRPQDANTDSSSRFFYPVNGEVEYNSAMDMSGYPGVESIPGEDHYVVFENTDGRMQASELAWDGLNIPAGAKVRGVAGFSLHSNAARGVRKTIDSDDFDRFSEECSYWPEAGTYMIVQADLSRFRADVPDPRFDAQGIAFLPQSEVLPRFSGIGSPDNELKYRLIGFINPQDRFVTWRGTTSETTYLVDWCVANSMVQNRLEEALLGDALPNQAHLMGLLSVNPGVAKYLEYFDMVHGTSCMPTRDPRYPHSDSRFAPLSSEGYERYVRLTELAHQRWNQPE